MTLLIFISMSSEDRRSVEWTTKLREAVIAGFRALAPGERLAIVHDHTWLEDFWHNIPDIWALPEKEEFGRLLCHASPIKVRGDYPIIGDLNPGELNDIASQSGFEENIFGTPVGSETRWPENHSRGDMPNE